MVCKEPQHLFKREGFLDTLLILTSGLISPKPMQMLHVEAPFSQNKSSIKAIYPNLIVLYLITHTRVRKVEDKTCTPGVAIVGIKIHNN